MRRRGLRAAGGEILGWGEIAKVVVGSVVVVSVGEGVDEGLEFVDTVREILVHRHIQKIHWRL